MIDDRLDKPGLCLESVTVDRTTDLDVESLCRCDGLPALADVEPALLLEVGAGAASISSVLRSEMFAWTSADKTKTLERKKIGFCTSDRR